MGGDNMGLWEQLPMGARRNGEQVLWEGAAAIQTGAIIDGNGHMIDTAGVDLGFLIVTTQQVIVGHRKKRALRREALEVWEALDADDLEDIHDDPRGKAFVVSRLGPVDLIVCAPARDLDGLTDAVNSFWIAN